MVQIDWSKYSPNTTIINLNSQGISEMNWCDGTSQCPQGLTYIGLGGNQISEMNWVGCPSG